MRGREWKERTEELKGELKGKGRKWMISLLPTNPG